MSHYSHFLLEITEKAINFLVESALENRHREMTKESDTIHLNCKNNENDDAERVDICC